MATSNFMSVFNSLPKFDGKENLASWLTRFNRCCAVTQKQEEGVKGQIIMLCLTGQALAVAEQLEQERDGTQTFAQVQARLESVFDTVASRERTMCEFESRIQKVDESEDEFMLSLVQLYKCANPNVADQVFQTAVKRKFIQGISPELRRALYVFVNDPSYAIIVSCHVVLGYTGMQSYTSWKIRSLVGIRPGERSLIPSTAQNQQYRQQHRHSNTTMIRVRTATTSFCKQFQL